MVVRTPDLQAALDLADRYFPNDCDGVRDTLTGRLWQWTKKDLVSGSVHLLDEDTGERVVVPLGMYGRFEPNYNGSPDA